MPRLLTQRKNQRRIPPCGRLILYRAPHSPFQKLIDTVRRRRRLSVRELARRIGVSQSTMWIWLHSENGFPHPKAFKSGHVQSLSRTLGIARVAIERAVDASRHIYTAREKPTPHAALDGFRNFIEIMEHDRRQTVSRSYVVNLAKRLYSGSRRK